MKLHWKSWRAGVFPLVLGVGWLLVGGEVSAQAPSRRVVPTKPVAAKTTKEHPISRKVAPADKRASAQSKSVATAPRVRPWPSVQPKPAVPRMKVIGPLVTVVLSNVEQTIERILETVELFGGEKLKKLGEPFLRKVAARFFPQLKEFTPYRAVQLVPKMLRPLGIDLSKPLGVMLWRAELPLSRQLRRANIKLRLMMQQRAVPIFVLSVDKSRLLTSLSLLGFSPRLKKLGGAELLTLGQAGKGSALGVLSGGRLYFTIRDLVPRLSLRQEARLRVVLQAVARQPLPLRSAFLEIGARKLWGKVASGEMDVALVVSKFSRFNLIPQARLVTRLLRGAGVAISLKRGYMEHFFVQGSPLLKPLFRLLAPGPYAQDWTHALPAMIGWYSQLHLNLDALHQLIEELPKLGLVPGMLAVMAKMRINAMKQKMKAQGIDLDQLRSMLSGQLMTGFLWDSSMQERLKAHLRGRDIRSHWRGVFALVGLKKASDGPKMLSWLVHFWKKLAAKFPKLARRIKILPFSALGLKMLSITIDKHLPCFFIVKDRMLLFAGDSVTRDQFAVVWKGYAPSFASHAQNNPKFARQMSLGAGSAMAINPRIFLDALHLPLPPNVKIPLETFALRLQSIRYHMTIQGARLESSGGIRLASRPIHQKTPPYNGPRLSFPDKMNFRGLFGISLVGMPVMSGLLGGLTLAVAIPSFVKFIRKSKTSEAVLNLKLIGDGAVAWFDNELYDENGDPLPKHFPHRDSPAHAPKGITKVVTPKAPPCANGKPFYFANPKRWNIQPWKSLKFAITKKHYYQYVYITSGIATNATFTIRAHADLDCDGILSTYQVTAKVNPQTGEIERSKLVVTNALE